MRTLKILTWHVHGSYLYYLSQVPHEIYLPVNPERSEGCGGLTSSFPWPSTLHEIPVEEVKRAQFDCILFQSRKNYLEDQYELLSEEQRRLPKLYLEHDPPREHPTDTIHPVDDPSVVVVHCTAFNRLMWDCRRSPTRVIDHGIKAPAEAIYTGELERGVTIVNNIMKRGRRLGADLFAEARNEVPLDLYGMGWEEARGVGEMPHRDIFARLGKYRFFFNPIRYTSLGLSVLEAMHVGVPIVGVATTEMVMAVQNGVNGYLSTEPSEVIAHMKRLLADPEEARHLSKGARRIARERYGIDRFVADWLALFEEVTMMKRPRPVQSERSSISGDAR